MKQNRNYKFCVRAYKLVDGKKVYIAKSPNVHVAMPKAKLTNEKSIAVAGSKITLNTAKTIRIKASSKKIIESKKLLLHVAKYRYYTTNASVATVSSKGKIKAKGKGSCYIYVLTNNGVYKKMKITVK